MVHDALAASATRESQLGGEVAAELRRRIMLSVLGRRWVGYIREVDDVYDGLMLRTAAGGDPLTEYQLAASRLATAMWQAIDEDFVGYWFNLEAELRTESAAQPQRHRFRTPPTESHRRALLDDHPRPRQGGKGRASLPRSCDEPP